MNKTKRVLSVVLAVLMLSSLIAALAIADNETCNVEIKYVFASDQNKQAAHSWTAKVGRGSTLNVSVTSPTVLGYAPRADQATVTINETISNDKTIVVLYYASEVAVTVNHYRQNIDNDGYTLFETENETGFTDDPVRDRAKQYEGFIALPYDKDELVAADGTTSVEIYYDRNYYLLSLNLDGGYGVEPIYAKYGTPISLGEPTKAGYTFKGWEPAAPATMPANGAALTAQWEADKTAKVTVVVWGENADDENYSYIKSVETTAPVGSTLTAVPSGTNLNMGTKLWELKRVEQTTVAADGSSVLNVYYDRKEFILTFKYDYRSVVGDGHVGATYQKTGTITAKWGADIGSRFLAMNAAAKGSLWSTEYSGDGPWTSFLQIMSEENRTYYCRNTSNTTQSAYYYTEGLDGKYVLKHTVVAYSGSDLAITAEDFYSMEGFTYDHGTDGEGKPLPKEPGDAGQWSGAKFYYKRNSYDLVFISNNTEVKKSKVKFEAALGTSNGESFAPSYPSNFEPNAFEFAGWYQDPEGVKPVDWDAKMPAARVTVYAKWVPVQHTVKTWLTDKMDVAVNVGETGSNVQTVAHRATAVAPAEPTREPYAFIGWFYKDENGADKAFDFSMPVTRDLDLFAKWSSNVMVEYTIKYMLKDANGNETTTEVAAPTTGNALDGVNKTFEAKAGEELYADYRTGYLPETNSHAMTISVEAEDKNEYIFWYVAKEEVAYTVRYLNAATNKPLIADKQGMTRDAIITEKFEQINGYAPDAYQKRLVLSANEEENVIIFWYTKDNVHAPVQVIHWVQNIAGDGYTEYQSSVDTNAEINKNQTSTALTITGFEYKRGTAVAGENTTEFTAPTAPSGTLTAEGLVLNLYYDRIEYPYEFRFVDRDGNNIADTVEGTARYQAQVTERAKKLEGDGWMLDTTRCSENGAINIVIEKQPDKNVYTFYYLPFYNIVHVKSGVAGDPVKTVIPNNNKDGLTDKVSDGYLYGGTFDNVDCTTVHNFGQENAINFTPVKGETYYIWEVSETYLKPRAYVVSRHDPNAIPDANGSTLNVVGLYLTSSVDRNMYSEVGFTVDGTNFASDGGKVYDKVQAVYTDGSGVKEEMYVMNDGVWDVKAQAPASRGGYVSICTVSMTTFYGKSAESPLSYQPYWVTLDGIKVTSAYEARTCYYQGVGYGDIAISNCVDSNSAVSIYRAATTNTIGVESVAVLSAAPETVQPEVPVTPEIPEVPEAPEMTLNSGAMYLRAQYTYEMMTNTVKFISAIDVNECTEYGFVINGEVVKCEEAAETVDGYDANYLFGGSVNGAMLMSCNMLLDGLVDGMTLNVTPYYVALDGTVVYGETRTLVYRQWVGLEG